MKSFEACEVRLSCQNSVIVLICLYRPPPSKKNKLKNSMFMEEFPDLLESLMSHDRLIIVGDFNFHFDSNTDRNVKDLKTLIDHHNLKQLVNVPTQIFGHTLDWILTNNESDVQDVHVVNKLISDHYVVSFDIPFRSFKRLTKVVSSRNINALDIGKFKADVSCAITAIRQSDSYVDDKVNDFNNSLRTVLDTHAPLSTRMVSDRTSKPWITQEIRDAKRARRRAERKWRKTGLTVHKQIYASKRNITNTLTLESKRNFVSRKINDSNTSKDLFKICGDLLGKNTTPTLPKSIPSDALPDAFNKFFIDKIENIRKDMNSNSKSSESTFYTGNNLKSFKNVTPDDVRKVISNC